MAELPKEIPLVSSVLFFSPRRIIVSASPPEGIMKWRLQKMPL